MTELHVDTRPAVARVTGLPQSYRLKSSETLVLLALACDSYDGDTTAPGMDALAEWTHLSRGTAYEVVKALTEPTANRPALLERTESTRGRNRTIFRLLLDQPSDFPGRLAAAEPSDFPGRLEPDQPVDNSPEPSGQPSGQPSGEPSGKSDPTLPYLNHYSPPSQRNHTAPVDNLPEKSGGDESQNHPHHGNAARALHALCLERDLPADWEELLPIAYRLGDDGDPFSGFNAIEAKTRESLASARDPRAVLAKRLSTHLGPRPTRTVADPPSAAPHSHRWTVDGTCVDPECHERRSECERKSEVAAA